MVDRQRKREKVREKGGGGRGRRRERRRRREGRKMGECDTSFAVCINGKDTEHLLRVEMVM